MAREQSIKKQNKKRNGWGLIGRPDFSKIGGFMSKKQKALVAEETLKSDKKQNEITQGNAVKSDTKAKDSKKNNKDVKKDNKKDQKKKDKKEKKEKGGIVRKTKETVSELKKVTWPTFGEVVKKTGIVVAFVVIFGLFLFGVNSLLGYLAKLLIKF